MDEAYTKANDAFTEANTKYTTASDKLKTLTEDYDATLILFNNLQTKFDLASEDFKTAAKPYDDALAAYNAALLAEADINAAIKTMNQTIDTFPVDKITQDNLANISTDIAAWKEKYDAAKQALTDALSNSWPIIEEYQAQNDLYNTSSIAPTSLLTSVFNPGDFKSKLTQYIVDAETAMQNNVDNAETYQTYYQAYSDYQLAFEEYTEGWSTNNVGDPNNDFEGVWRPAINSLYTLDFTSIGYSDDDLKAITTIGDWELFIAAYEKIGLEKIDEASQYSDYLAGVAAKWAEAKVKLADEINAFNAKTGSNVEVDFDYNVDYITSTAKAMVTGLKTTHIYNLDMLNSFPLRSGDDAYTWLRGKRFSNAQSYRGSISGQEEEDIITPLPPFVPEMIQPSL